MCQQPSDPVRREEQTIDFRCEVTYTGYKAPMLQWRDENGLVLESEYEADDANPNRVVYDKSFKPCFKQLVHIDMFHFFRLFYNKTAEPSDHEQEYTCHLWFQQDEGEAEEAPVLTDHCSITYWIERKSLVSSLATGVCCFHGKLSCFRPPNRNRNVPRVQRQSADDERGRPHQLHVQRLPQR